MSGRPPRPWFVRSFPPKVRTPGVDYSTWSAPFVKSERSTAKLIHRVRYVCKSRTRMIAVCWCGQAVFDRPGASMMSHTHGPVCATCEGRAIGAGQVPQHDPAVLYFPRT